MKNYWLYMLTNKNNKVLYIGMTGNLRERILKHKSGYASLFTTKYKCTKLVYYEKCLSKQLALNQEKRFKKWNREWKITLIEKSNPGWKDLFDTLDKVGT